MACGTTRGFATIKNYYYINVGCIHTGVLIDNVVLIEEIRYTTYAHVLKV